MQALEQATSQAVAMKGSENLEGLIHHSDRGVQYCCDDYVAMLQSHGIAISMTGDYNPTDNAIAERTNGVIKIERVYSQRHFNDIEHARNVIGRYIHFYNYCRPHMSIGYKVPAVAHLEQGEQKRMWKKKKNASKNVKNENNDVLLQSRTTESGESVCRST
ncbi:integrase core domain protein [Prevotella sp. CAG:1320]|nr:integrase core domain protein [Prevotella sp. CAG:1320]